MSLKKIQRHFEDGGESATGTDAGVSEAQGNMGGGIGMGDPNQGPQAPSGPSPSMGDPNQGPSIEAANPGVAQQISDQQAANALGMSLDAYRGVAYEEGAAPALMGGMGNRSAVTPSGSWSVGNDGRTYGNLQDAARALGVSPSSLNAEDGSLPGYLGMASRAIGWLQDMGLPGYAMTPEERAAREAVGSSNHGENSGRPFASAPAQTTDQKKVDETSGAGASGTGMPHYTWDPALGRYTLVKSGSGSAAVGNSKGQTWDMYRVAPPAAPAFAEGGPVSGGLQAAAAQPRFVKGPGDGQSDDIPVKMSDGGQGFLADSEFVIPADAVSALGSGSSDAGARALYEMVDRIRQHAHGHTKQANPIEPNKIMPA